MLFRSLTVNITLLFLSSDNYYRYCSTSCSARAVFCITAEVNKGIGMTMEQINGKRMEAVIHDANLIVIIVILIQIKLSLSATIATCGC